MRAPSDNFVVGHPEWERGAAVTHADVQGTEDRDQPGPTRSNRLRPRCGLVVEPRPLRQASVATVWVAGCPLIKLGARGATMRPLNDGPTVTRRLIARGGAAIFAALIVTSVAVVAPQRTLAQVVANGTTVVVSGTISAPAGFTLQALNGGVIDSFSPLMVSGDITGQAQSGGTSPADQLSPRFLLAFKPSARRRSISPADRRSRLDLVDYWRTAREQ
jgi:hypothetical protein